MPPLAAIRLRNAYRAVFSLVVDVHERSCDTGERFELILQRLADVVRLPQRGLCVHNNINFNEVIRSALHIENVKLAVIPSSIQKLY